MTYILTLIFICVICFLFGLGTSLLLHLLFSKKNKKTHFEVLLSNFNKSTGISKEYLTELKMEEKFIVINFKRLYELQEFDKGAVDKLLRNIREFEYSYITKVGKQLNQKYIVCNQDEPYANDVWNIIQLGESNKINMNNTKNK